MSNDPRSESRLLSGSLVAAGSGILLLVAVIAMVVLFSVNHHAACMTLRYVTVVTFFGSMVLLPFALLATLDDNSPGRRRLQMLLLSSVAVLGVVGVLSIWTIIMQCGKDAAFIFP